MAEIKRVNGRSTIDYMARDYESLLQAMREQIPDKLPEWTDYTSEADFGNVLLQLFAHMGDILSYYQDRIANESFLSTAQTRQSVIDHLRLIGYHLSTAAPATTNLVVRVPASYDNTLTLRKGNAFGTQSQPDQDSIRFEYTSNIDLTIDCGNLPLDPDDPDQKIYMPGIPVEEGQLIADEILGESDGRPNQRFPLVHRGVIIRSFNTVQDYTTSDISLRTEVSDPAPDQDLDIAEWSLRETLAFSREEQQDFIVEIDDQDQATIIFGDGTFGKIPPRGYLMKVTYRFGGGRLGNVGASTIETIVDAPDLTLAGATVTNPTAASGGADRESLDHAILHAPKIFRSLKRAVTADDYEALALDFAGVSKVRAEATQWNTVTLYVAPTGGGSVSDVLEADLLAYFEDKRPIATQIEIANVDYVKIYIAATVGVESYYSRNLIQEKVEVAVNSLLALENVDFKQTLYLSKFYEAIEAIAGVAYVNITEFRSQSKSPGIIEENGKIELGSNELPVTPQASDEPEYPNGIRITLEGGG